MTCVGVCVTELVESPRGCSISQSAFGEHILDRSTDRSFPFHTLTKRYEESRSTTVLGGCL